MARQPYRPMEAEPLRPVASPVDTFVRPQEPSRDTSLQDLARSLSGLGGSLAGMVGTRDKEAEDQDRIRGEAAFWQANGTGAAEAVAKGIIPAQASPAFLKAYKRLEGEVAGGQLEQKFSAAYDTWEGKSSTDPKAYDAFVGGFIKENIKTEDPDVLRGLLPKVHQVAQNYLQRHIGDASKATQSGFTTALSARGEQAIDEANSAGLASKTGTDYAGVFGKLEAIRAEGLKVGANREQVDNKLIDTVTAAAITKRDPKLLDFLDRKVPGTDYTWGNTPYGRDQRQKTIDTLETMGRRSIADDEKRNREERAAAKDDVTRRTIQAITKAPNDPIPEDLLAAGEKVDPDFRINAIRWRDTIGKGAQTSDPEDMLAITTDIINGGGLQRVQRGIRERAFRNPEDLTRAYKLAEGMKTEGPKLDEMLRVGTAKTIIDTLKRQTATEKDLSKLMFDDGSMSREGLQSTSDYKQALMEWLIENPRATSLEREKAAQEIGAKFLDRLKQPDGPQSTTYYDREGLGSPNTFGSSAPPKVDPTTTEPAPVAKPPAPRPGPVFADPYVKVPSGLPGVEDTPAPRPAAPEGPVKLKSTYDGAAAWYKSLPAETKAAMKTMAEKQGITERAMSQILHQRALDAGLLTSDTDPTPVQRPATPAPAASGKQSTLKAPDGTPIETASAEEGDRIGRAFQEAIDAPPTSDTVRLIGEAFQRAIAATGKPAGNYSAATLTDNPKAARILDFVAGPESRGNYNAYFGNAGSTKDLSVMSLDQVMAWSSNRGTASSATGRYQFMQGTLRGLKQEMGLSGSERFTPELQDKMALQLLERRGFSKWTAGQLSTEQFANNLALEWAALPNLIPQRGRGVGQSAYEGDGLNKALVTPGAVMVALGGAAGAPAAPTRTGIAGMVSRLLGRKSPHQTAPAASSGPAGPGDVYASIPDVEGAGRPGQRAKFLEWNPDPVGNNERNLQSINPSLAAVIRKAQADNPALRFVVASGHRDGELQAKAVKWGWSKTNDSNHEHGDAADVWVLNDKGQVVFDQKLQEQAAAIKKAAGELGTRVNWGGDFRSFKDRPHFELAKTRRA